jgi:hypothetical protein
MLKKYKWPIIAGLAIIIGAIYVLWNPPSTKDALEYWRGSYNELKRITATDEFIKLKVITDLREQNSLLQSSIDSANTIIANLEQDVVVAEVAVAEARKGWAAFSTECQAKLKELDLSWSAVHKIDREEIEQYKTSNFDLQTQYQTELKISANYRSLWENEKSLRLKCEVGIGLSDKRIASLNRTIKLTRLCAVVAIVATVFLVKK